MRLVSFFSFSFFPFFFSFLLCILFCFAVTSSKFFKKHYNHCISGDCLKLRITNEAKEQHKSDFRMHSPQIIHRFFVHKEFMFRMLIVETFLKTKGSVRKCMHICVFIASWFYSVNRYQYVQRQTIVTKGMPSNEIQWFYYRVSKKRGANALIFFLSVLVLSIWQNACIGVSVCFKEQDRWLNTLTHTQTHTARTPNTFSH